MTLPLFRENRVQNVHDSLVLCTVSSNILIHGNLEGGIGQEPVVPFAFAEERKHHGIDSVYLDKRLTHIRRSSHHRGLTGSELSVHGRKALVVLGCGNECIIDKTHEVFEDRKPEILVEADILTFLLTLITLSPDNPVNGSQIGYRCALKQFKACVIILPVY